MEFVSQSFPDTTAHISLFSISKGIEASEENLIPRRAKVLNLAQ